MGASAPAAPGRETPRATGLPGNGFGVEWPGAGPRRRGRTSHGNLRNLPNGKGLGTFIWEPTSGALFDSKGAAKAEIDAYPEMANAYGGK
jgi:hypothetical protein